MKQEDYIEILGKDLFYQEAIFEILENNNADFLILNEKLQGNDTLENLIIKIKEKNKNIKIILILDRKNKMKEEKIKKYQVYKIFYNNEVQIEQILNELNKKAKNKKIFENKNIQLNIEEKKDEEDIKEKIARKKVICISGTRGIGKSIFTVNFANCLKNKKVLIIDFDILNKSLHTILGVDNYSQKINKNILESKIINNKLNLKNLVIKINNQIDLISGINLIFIFNYKLKSNKIENIINVLKNNYEYILIDTSSECFFNYTKEIMKNSDLILFLSGANLLEIEKSKYLLKIFSKEWKIEKNKINIIFNKITKYSMDNKILEKIFNEYLVIGKVNLKQKYDFMINNKRKKEEKDISKEINKIKKYIYF